jgi:hypothetical protein
MSKAKAMSPCKATSKAMSRAMSKAMTKVRARARERVKAMPLQRAVVALQAPIRIKVRGR